MIFDASIADAESSPAVLSPSERDNFLPESVRSVCDRIIFDRSWTKN